MSNVKIYAKTVEQEALDQINQLTAQPAFADCKIRIMPDVHAGKGCVIGFTADLGDKVIPNIVGVDIGCGMLTVEINRAIPRTELTRLDEVIRSRVPSGFNVHDGRFVRMPELQELHCYRELRDTRRIECSIGTLGGGNHFIEIDEDDAGKAYLVIHTGSRNLGKQVADIYQTLAYELMQGKDELFQREQSVIAEYKAAGRRSEIQAVIKALRAEYKARDIDIPKDLAYLMGEHRERYLHDMRICQQFAVLNRQTIADIIMNDMGWEAAGSFQTIHNYIDHDSNIVRKGAVSAKEGERLLIPINMRDGSLICVGRGNNDWNQSAPHGAGRLMSRTKARETLSMEAYQEVMSGVFTTSVSRQTIDEAPMAYKPMDEIVSCIGDTVEIESVIRPVYNFKASE